MVNHDLVLNSMNKNGSGDGFGLFFISKMGALAMFSVALLIVLFLPAAFSANNKDLNTLYFEAKQARNNLVLARDDSGSFFFNLSEVQKKADKTLASLEDVVKITTEEVPIEVKKFLDDSPNYRQTNR